MASSASLGNPGTISSLGPRRPSPPAASHFGGKEYPESAWEWSIPPGIPAASCPPLPLEVLTLGHLCTFGFLPISLLAAETGRFGAVWVKQVRVKSQVRAAPPPAPFPGGLGDSPKAEQLQGRWVSGVRSGVAGRKAGWERGYSQDSPVGAVGRRVAVLLDSEIRDFPMGEHFLGAAVDFGSAD